MLGADVIKIEPPDTGDQMRDRMLPSPLSAVGMAGAFLAMNGGKRSLALDLKRPEARDILHALIARSDVLVHNFRQGVVQRLGLDHAEVAPLNPRLIYCSITGYGNAGPLAAHAAYDGAVQAASGMMANNGDPDSGPMRTGYFPVDMMTAMNAAFAISAALVRRAREGKGRAIDVAMLDAAIVLQAAGFGQYLVDGTPGGLIGNSSATGHPTADCFRTGDGLVLMSATLQNHVDALGAEMGLVDVLAEPRFATATARIAHRDDLRALLQNAFLHDTAERWAQRLGARGVPIARVSTIAETAALEQLRSRNVIVDAGTPARVGRPVRAVGTAFTTDDDPPALQRPAPALGQHTRAILQELGYEASRIAALGEAGVVSWPED